MAFISNIFHYNNISLLKETFVDKQQHRKENCFIPICWHYTILLNWLIMILLILRFFSHNSEITFFVSKKFRLVYFLQIVQNIQYKCSEKGVSSRCV